MQGTPQGTPDVHVMVGVRFSRMSKGNYCQQCRLSGLVSVPRYTITLTLNWRPCVAGGHSALLLLPTVQRGYRREGWRGEAHAVARPQVDRDVASYSSSCRVFCDIQTIEALRTADVYFCIVGPWNKDLGLLGT